MSNQQNAVFEEVAEKTDFGHFIYEKRKLLTVIGVITVVGLIGFSFWKSQKEESRKEVLEKVYVFEKESLAPFVEGKTKPEEILKSYNNLRPNVLSDKAMLPIVLELSSKLEAEGKLADAKDILEKYIKHFSTSHYGFQLLATRLAVLYENQKNYKSAIDILKKLSQSSVVLLTSKVHLDLGRLNLLEKNRDKAKTHFEWVIKNDSKSEVSKLAKFYLKEMN